MNWMLTINGIWMSGLQLFYILYGRMWGSIENIGNKRSVDRTSLLRIQTTCNQIMDNYALLCKYVFHWLQCKLSLTISFIFIECWGTGFHQSFVSKSAENTNNPTSFFNKQGQQCNCHVINPCSIPCWCSGKLIHHISPPDRFWTICIQRFTVTSISCYLHEASNVFSNNNQGAATVTSNSTQETVIITFYRMSIW